MKYYLTLLILWIVLVMPLQLVYALPSPELVPEPKPKSEQAFDHTSCGEGTTYRDGICVMDETYENPNTSSDCWGGPECTYDERPNLHTSPLRQTLNGIPPQNILCNEGLTLIQKYNGSPACVTPETKQKLIERGWAKSDTIKSTDVSKYTEEDIAANLLTQNQIKYIPDKLVVTGGSAIRGDPRCGAVIDLNATTHWFGIDSISNPQKMTLFSENPNPCRVNTGSCFCNAQMELTALTLDELSYFSSEEEELVANTLIDYLVKENINRTPKFMVGKFNINYTDPSAIGYCGELWGYNTIDYFDGAIVNDQVEDYGLAKELSPLCAIAEDAKWWE